MELYSDAPPNYTLTIADAGLGTAFRAEFGEESCRPRRAWGRHGDFSSMLLPPWGRPDHA